MATEDSFEKVLKKAKFHVEEMAEILQTDEPEDIKMAYEKVCEIYKTLETSITGVTEAMLDDDKPLDEVRSWSKSKKDEANVVRNFRSTLKERLTEIDERETQKEHDRTLYQQKVILEEQANMNREQQKQSEEARARQQQQEEEWFKKRLELELELAKKKSEESATKPMSVKLQKYTITVDRKRRYQPICRTQNAVRISQHIPKKNISSLKFQERKLHHTPHYHEHRCHLNLPTLTKY